MSNSQHHRGKIVHNQRGYKWNHPILVIVGFSRHMLDTVVLFCDYGRLDEAAFNMSGEYVSRHQLVEVVGRSSIFH